MKKRAKRFFTVVICMVLVLSVSKEVYADTSSNWTYASVGGQSYHFRSEVSTRNNRAEGVIVLFFVVSYIFFYTDGI